MNKNSEDAAQSRGLSINQLAIASGPLVAIATYFALSSGTGLSEAECRTAAIAALMASWWMTEAIPLAVTSLLPLVLFPLADVLKIEEACAPYAEKSIFLFLGGFLIALAVERWNLHRRLALLTILAVGVNPRNLIGGTMLATGLISMWISNTATAVLMLPIALSLVSTMKRQLGLDDDSNTEVESKHRVGYQSFATCMMLGVAYAATIGGLGTLVGTPTNVVLAGFAHRNNLEIGFANWMLLGTPVAAIYLFIAWALMTWIIFPQRLPNLPGGRQLIREELEKLGPMSRGEWSVLVIFASVAMAWILRAPLNQWAWLINRVPAIGRVDDTIIGIAGGIALFVIPVDARRGVFVLDWHATQRLPWGILLLFGGGFCLAKAIEVSKLAQSIGASIEGIKEFPLLIVLASVALLIIVLGEFASNTPTAAAFLPILYSLGKGMGIDPLLLLVTGTLAASCSFMLPVGTPPNAIVFSSGHIRTSSMLRAGLILDLLGVVLLPVMVYVLGPIAMGIRV